MRAVKAPPQANGARPARLSREEGAELHDTTLERDFLGACIVYPDLVLASGVVDGDFFSAANRTVFQGLLQLAADGEPINTQTLQGVLHDRGTLANVGGLDYLLALTDGVPSREVPIQRLRKLARKRRVQDLASIIAAKAGTDELDRYLAALDVARAELVAVEHGRIPLRTLAECIPLIRQVGPRLPIGLPKLDGATRGGLPMGKLVALIGAPGANKTNLCTWLANGWERAGCAVMIIAADESRESVITRLGQLDGFDRELLEGEDDGRRNAFARNSRSRALVVVDPFEDRISLEQAERALLEFAGPRPRVLIVDSLQTVPSDAATLLEQRRDQVDAKVEILAHIAKRGTLVVCVSEMSRAGYRTGRADQDISALAAAAESRALEYASHLLIGLKPVKSEVGLVDCEVAKNRLGPGKPNVRLSLNFETLAFREIDKPDDDEAEREAEKFAKIRARLAATVARNTELRTVNAVIRAAGARKRDGGSVLREMIDDGAIQKVDGVYRVVAPIPSAPAPAPEEVSP